MTNKYYELDKSFMCNTEPYTWSDDAVLTIFKESGHDTSSWDKIKYYKIDNYRPSWNVTHKDGGTSIGHITVVKSADGNYNYHGTHFYKKYYKC